MSITPTLARFPCCPKPNINSMMKAPDVNAVCCNCGVHWYGVAGKVRRFTRQEWDALLLESMTA